MKAHLTQDELLDRLYGLRAPHEDDAHLPGCAECSGRLQAMERVRAESANAAAMSNEFMSNDFMVAQRRAMHAKIDRADSVQVRWAPALAAAFLLVIGMVLYHPHAQFAPARKAEATAKVELNTDQLFSDLYSMEQSVEPQAAAPIHGLFEGDAGTTEEQ